MDRQTCSGPWVELCANHEYRTLVLQIKYPQLNNNDNHNNKWTMFMVLSS